MRLITSSRQSSKRHLALALAAVVTVAGLSAPAWAQEAQQQQQAPGRVFGSDAGMIFNTIKPDKVADFEEVMGKLKEALTKSDNPVRRQQAVGWKVFKSVEPGPGGNVLYIFMVDPAVKDADYTISKILYEAFPQEVQEIYKKFSESFAGGQNLVNLQLVQNFGQ
jgi:hypothetical protein